MPEGAGRFGQASASERLASAKKAAHAGPVIVTDRGRPTDALLKIEDYDALTGARPTSLLAVMESIPGGDFEFEPPRLPSGDPRPAEFGTD